MTRGVPQQMGGGVQAHHQSNLAGATKDLGNAVAWLSGVAEITESPSHQTLLDDARALCTRVSEAYRIAHEQLVYLSEMDRDLFMRCRNGLEPWPGETLDGFEPVCTCDRRCLFHVTKADGSTEKDCNCALVCPRHLIPRVPGDREPLKALPSLTPEMLEDLRGKIGDAEVERIFRAAYGGEDHD